MQFPSLSQMVPILQTAIGPVILISGIGLLLLTMTNRLGRVIDRARVLAGGFPDIEDSNREKVEAQLHILWKRAGLLRTAITLASMSALLAAILIIALFFSALWQIDSAWLIGIVFIVCMLCLIGSLGTFIHDLNQSLAALKLELDGVGNNNLLP